MYSLDTLDAANKYFARRDGMYYKVFTNAAWFDPSVLSPSLLSFFIFVYARLRAADCDDKYSGLLPRSN